MEIVLNVGLVVLLAAIVFGIVLYLYRAKKRGEACIGCPHAGQCGGACGGTCKQKSSKDQTDHE
jgi:hypothetical protein